MGRGPRLLELNNAKPDEEIAEFAKSVGSKGQTVVYLRKRNASSPLLHWQMSFALKVMKRLKS